MWKLLLLSTLCLQVHATIYFQQIGWMSPSPSYGHIHFSIDTNIIAQHASNLRILIGSVRKMVHTIPHESTQKRADRFLLRAHLDIEEIIKDFSDFKMIISDTQPDQKRSKRFLELLLGIGSLTLSLFNQAEIMHLQGSISTLATQQSHIVDILQEHEVAIHSLRHDISKIRDGFLTIINITQENYAATKLHDIELEIIMALTELRRTVTCVQHGLERLLSHRVPICFLNSTKINESIKNLNNKAQPYKLESISKHIPGFLQYETSFLLINEQIHIFVHVPLINFDSQLNLLRFNNAPLQITQSYSIQMALTEDVIAINKHGQHSVISQTELTRYNKYGEYFMGNTPVSLHTQINQTCLGSIYSQNIQSAKKRCPVKFTESEESLFNIAANEYIFLTKEPQTIQITCTKTTTHVAVHKEKRITLKTGCEIKTATTSTTMGHNLYTDQDIITWPFNWNLSHTMFDLDPHKLEEVIKSLNLIHYPNTPIRDLHQIIHSPHTFTFWITIVILIIFAFLVLILSYLGYRYWIIRKQTNTKQGGDFSENGRDVRL